MTECNYEKNISGLNGRRTRKFECHEDALALGKCKFHDDAYLNPSTEQDIRDSLQSKIQDASRNNKVLDCVGYIIPNLEVDSKNFSKSVSFANAIFRGDFIIDNSEFNSFVDFSNCIFEGEASFSNVLFSDNVDYISSNFNASSYFENTTFNEKVDFSSAEFANASFFLAEFHYADFTNVNFKEFVTFGSTEFHKEAYFPNAVFNKGVNFSASKFYDDANFVQSIFSNYAHFRKTSFFKQKQVIFEADLSQVSFRGTDISRVKFANKIKWNIDEDDENNKVLRFFSNLKHRNNKFKIYDEFLLEKGREPSLQLEDVMDVYRNLRENCDYYLRYEVAGEFFVREMELKRKYQKNKALTSIETIHKQFPKQYVSIYGIYNLISQYGHSLYRPIYASIPILALFTTLFCFENASQVSNGVLNLEDAFVDAIFRSTSSFFPFYSVGVDISHLDIILRIILLPLSATFFIALKRKLERKFRH